jgi:cleavage and polyadenylation specificity factor subunit 3
MGQSINAIDYHQEISLGCLRFTSYPAGHVLGAAMFLIEISGIRVLYTGDYSTEEDRHLIPARVPNWNEKPDVMICESTYGVQSLEPRFEKEERFTSKLDQLDFILISCQFPIKNSCNSKDNAF